MRLSKNTKEVILNNWKNKKHSNIERKLKESLCAELKIIFEEQFKDKIDIVKNNQHIKEYLSTHSYFRCELYDLDFIHTGVISCDKYVTTSRYDQARIEVTTKVKKVIDKHIAKYQKYKEERNTLQSVMLSCTTVKKLVDILPEIEKYIPKSSSTTTLVAAGDLVKAKEVL